MTKPAISSPEFGETIKIHDADRGYDELEAVVRNGEVTITVEEPWAGDTETGFGQHCSIRMSAEEARTLGEWLLHWSKEPS